MLAPASKSVRSLKLGAPALLGLLALALTSPSCSSDDTTPHAAGKPSPPVVPAGEICDPADPSLLSVRFQPSSLVLAACSDDACAPRKVRVIVDPDICKPRTLSFASSDAAVIAAPASASVTLHKGSVEVDVQAKQAGKSTLTVTLPRADDGDPDPGGEPVTATLDVEVLEPVLAKCSGTAAKAGLGGGDELRGTGGLAGASIGLPAGAAKANENAFLWHVDPFDASLACGDDMTPDGYIALGPAVTFGPATLVLNREIPLSVPVNPALMPNEARARHIKVAYSGPRFHKPRMVPVADPRLEKIDGQWVFTFKAPMLGTYQVMVAKDAGTTVRKRKITHRAVVGVSMGGGGTAMVGMRHHDKFDVIAPLGGPVDWTWMIDNISTNHLGGFRPIAKGTVLADIPLTKVACTKNSDCEADEICLGAQVDQGQCTLMPKATEPYAHPQTFNNWWYEYPRTGNGGSFARQDYAQIFRDLALMFGNPNGDNLSKGGENLPAGVPPTHASVVGTSGDCGVWVDPLDGPDHDKQQAIANKCPAERCANPLTLNNYFDDEYNPDGTFPVITVCDGVGQSKELTPYANTWRPEGNGYPLEVGLAVDYNGNGVRDEMEPIISAGHEPWRDDGVDHTPSSLEPGYEAGVNDDPNGDDYHPQYNPTGTEGDRRYQEGELFDDVGLDGVAGTAQQPKDGWKNEGDGYDVGEGDGKFTASRGLRRFWDYDARSVIRKWAPEVPGGELTDEALARIDVWSDGGTRDLFNFGVDATHFTGGFVARGRDAAYFTQFTAVPGLDPSKPKQYLPQRIDWEDLQGVVFQRYGKVDPTEVDENNGSGQHVGTVEEIASRLQSALYFIGSRWRSDPLLRTQQHSSAEDPDPNAPECEISGNCTFEFTSKDGRTGPVGISLPPGYSHKDLLDRRYPVIYMLHGYGQNPQDLEAAIVFLRNWMNSPIDGMESRLPKAILVYVDGRCRIGKTGKAECLRGTFFTDSVRADGVKTESWWMELMGYVDQKYRTMGETEVDWAD
jgi:hypothetical protein